MAVGLIAATQMSLQGKCLGVSGVYGDTAENRIRPWEFRPFLFEQLSPSACW